ncbi:hypothetical protein [Halorarius halobius]|uniref:hypothetical protein n=1 Tax=Halorarius halobius TaxID=2962671 RepID=UPI0020CCA043|nr:hypothetical protein [Halorarius halobius]
MSQQLYQPPTAQHQATQVPTYQQQTQPQQMPQQFGQQVQPQQQLQPQQSQIQPQPHQQAQPQQVPQQFGQQVPSQQTPAPVSYQPGFQPQSHLSTQTLQPQQSQQAQSQPPMLGQAYGAETMGSEIRSAVSQRFAESVPNEVVTLTNDLDRLATVSEWAKNRATERGMPRLARVCDDIQDIATLEKKLVIRQSPFAQPVGEASRQVIQNGIAELQQHLSQPEVQEALSEAQQSVGSIQNALSRLQSFGTQGQQYGQVGGTQQSIGIQ